MMLQKQIKKVVYKTANASPPRSCIKYIKRQPCAPMYGRLYHYEGNNPVRYVDPDGRITQHKDLSGRDRLVAESKDIIQGSIKEGLFFGGSFSFWDIFSFGGEIDFGSIEVSGSLNKETETRESAGVSFELSVLDFLGVCIDIAKSRDVPADEELDDFCQALSKIYTEGDFSVDIGGQIGPLSSSSEDRDVKVGIEIGLGIGIGIWINLSEAKDFVNCWMNGDF